MANETKIAYEKIFGFDNVGAYSLIVTADGQIVLEKLVPGFDEYDHELPRTMYKKANNPRLGMLVYKKAYEILVDYIYEKKPHYLWYDTGGEKIRFNLYKKFAELLAKRFDFNYLQDGDTFYFYAKID